MSDTIEPGAFEPVPDPAGDAGEATSPTPHSQPGATFGDPNAYGQAAANDQPATFGQPGPYGQPGHYGQPGPYGEPGAYGQAGAYGQPGAYGQAPAQPVDLRTVTGPAPILVSIAPAAQQRRVTVAFRAILLIPQGVVLWVLSIAAGVVAFIGWWAALFTGQLPEWAHRFLTSFLRWSTRVSAYGYLLTDTYPPFELEDTDYPVRLLTKPTRLNRLAVLFRFILAIPVALVTAVAGFGIAIISPFAWLITLISGRMPESLHQAITAIVRFVARYNGYAYLLTPEYPAGLYGDRPESAPAAPQPTVGLGAGAALADPTPAADASPAADTIQIGDATPAADATQAADASQAADTIQITDAAQAADPWRLVLSSRARSLVTLSLVLGVLGVAAYVVFLVTVTSSSVNNVVSRNNALIKVNSAYSQLNSVVQQFQTQTEACNQQLSCITALDSKVSQAFQSFGTSVQAAGIPSLYSAAAGTLNTDTTKVTNDFKLLAGAPTATQYEGIASSLNLEATLSQWQADFAQLEKRLSTG